LNGLLHLNKTISLLLFQAQTRGLKEDSLERLQQAARVARKVSSILAKGIGEIRPKQ